MLKNEIYLYYFVNYRHHLMHPNFFAFFVVFLILSEKCILSNLKVSLLWTIVLEFYKSAEKSETWSAISFCRSWTTWHLAHGQSRNGQQRLCPFNRANTECCAQRWQFGRLSINLLIVYAFNKMHKILIDKGKNEELTNL